jgi:hypothetical protein
MARTARATKLVIQDNPDGKYLIKGGGPKIPRDSDAAEFNTGDATGFRKAVDMSDDELAAIVARAKLTVV